MNCQRIVLPFNHQQKIQVYMTVAQECIQNLFDFKTQTHSQARLFKGMFVYLPVPKKTPVYYFFHKHKHNSQVDIKIQRRKECISKISFQSKLLSNYRLLGGIAVYTGEGHSVLLRPLRASDILQEVRNNIQLSISQEETTFRPHFIVRTFQSGYPLKSGQTIRLGKLSFYVTQVSEGLKSFEDMVRDGEILRISEEDSQGIDQQHQLCLKKEKITEQYKQQVQHKLCKYCFEEGQTEEDFLITACKCKGTSKFVHINCLKQWLEQKNKCVKQSEQNLQQPSFSLFCDVCKQKLPKVVIKGRRKYQLLDIFKDDQKYVAFHHIFDGNPWRNLINRYMIPLVKDKPITIGRQEGHTVELLQGTVSRQHALICLNHKGKAVIKDTCSKYGTLLYDPQAEIKLGQKCRALQIENIVFSFKLTDRSDYP